VQRQNWLVRLCLITDITSCGMPPRHAQPKQSRTNQLEVNVFPSRDSAAESHVNIVHTTLQARRLCAEHDLSAPNASHPVPMSHVSYQ